MLKMLFRTFCLISGKIYSSSIEIKSCIEFFFFLINVLNFIEWYHRRILIESPKNIRQN